MTLYECIFDLTEYEQTFRKLAYGDRLLKSDLPKFFTACDLHPTEGEIQQAFEKVFKGGLFFCLLLSVFMHTLPLCSLMRSKRSLWVTDSPIP